MEKKNLSDLVDIIRAAQPEPRENIENFVREFFELIRDALLQEHFVKIRGFGTFKLVDVSSRESIDVNTGERIEIGGHAKVTFTPDNAMRDAVNRPFAHLEAFVINEGTDIETMSRTDGDFTEADEAVPAETAENVAEPPEVIAETEEYIEEPTENIEESVEYVEEPNDDAIEVTNDVPEQEEEEEQAETDALPVSDEVVVESPAVPEDEAEAPVQEDVIPANDNKERTESNDVKANNKSCESKEETIEACCERKWLKPLVASVSAVALLALGYLAGYYRILSPCDACEQPEFVAEAESAVVPTDTTMAASETTSTMAAAEISEDTTNVAEQAEQEATPAVPQGKSDATEEMPANAELQSKTSDVKSSKSDSQPASTTQKSDSKTPVAENKTPKADTKAKKAETKKPAPAAVPILKPEPGDAYIIVGVKTTYKLQKGESIIRLAKREYGDKSFAKYIIRLNSFENPDNIPVGTDIKMPEVVLRKQ